MSILTKKSPNSGHLRLHPSPLTIETRCDVEVVLNHTQISAALAPYRPEYRMVVEARCWHWDRRCRATIVLSEYPFTLEPLPYTSLQLLNLATEQVLLVYLRFEVAQHLLRTPLWHDPADYDAKVADGHWLVPQLQTRVRRPIRMGSGVPIEAAITASRLSERGYRIEFASVSEAGFSTTGSAVFVREVPGYAA